MAPRKKKEAKPSDTETAQDETDVVSKEDSSLDSGFFHDQSNGSASPEDDVTFSWTAPEFIAHQKSARWYALLALWAIIIAALVYLLTKDKISTAVVLVAAAVLGFYGQRQPRQLDYQIDSQGIKIGQRLYPYHSFRSYSVVPDEAFSSIVFMPMKRFGTATTIYYALADEDQIIQFLSKILPLQEHLKDPIDQLMKRIRF